jgi:hypothetical protein
MLCEGKAREEDYKARGAVGASYSECPGIAGSLAWKGERRQP